MIKVCVRYIFASLFFKSKLSLVKTEKMFFISLQNSFRSRVNQVLEF